MMLSRHAKRNESCAGCRRSCNARNAQDVQSLCNHLNFGSFDGWVHRFDAPLRDPVALALLRTPRHAFGADNVMGHVFEQRLRVRLANRCYRYRLYHLHCRLPTSTKVPSDAKRGYGERTHLTHQHMELLLLKHDLNLSAWPAAKLIVTRKWRPSH